MKGKETCIFYNEQKRICTALKLIYCDTDIKPCKFYKPKATAGEEEKQVAGKL